MWFQKTISLPARSRGFHLVTKEILDQVSELRKFKVGIAHFFIKHTSASLTINENCDPDVRSDMEEHFNKFIPESAPYYEHVLEGADDMPAHIKTSTIGCELSIPITNGGLALGTWQGIYLGEHRNYGGSRKIIVTINGETF